MFQKLTVMILLSLGFVLLFGCAPATSPSAPPSSTGATPAWARSVVSASATTSFNATATDSLGNVYAAGFVTGTDAVDFGNDVTATGTKPSESAVLVKFSNSGTATWARTLSSGSPVSYLHAVTIDSTDNIYVVGTIRGGVTADFGDDVTATGAGTADDAVLVKYDTSGTPQWVRTISSATAGSEFRAVTTDSEGNVYAAGVFYGTDALGFGSGVTVTAGSSDGNAVLVKYDRSGTPLWARTTTGSSGSEYSGVSADSSDNVYSVGYIVGTNAVGFGGDVTATGASADYNTLIVKYDGSGTSQWARTTTGTSGGQFFSVSTDSSDNVYAVGQASGTGASASNNALLLKYDSSGTAQWSRVASGTSASQFKGVALDPSGNVYAVGSIVGTDAVGFGSGVTATGTSTDSSTVLLKYSSSGTPQWARTTTSGTSTSFFNSVAIRSDTIYAAGYLGGSAALDFGNSVTATGAYSGGNALLVQYQ